MCLIATLIHFQPKKLRRIYSAALKSEMRAAIIHRKRELHKKLAAHHDLPLLSKPLQQKIMDAVRNLH